jgi:hypothetical protein
MRCAMPTKVIKLPCKARELAETIRCFCEHHGSFDTAVVEYKFVKSIYAYDPGVTLVITIPEETKEKK